MITLGSENFEGYNKVGYIGYSVVDIWCKIVAFVQAPESSEGAGEETGALAVAGGVVGTVVFVAALA